MGRPPAPEEHQQNGEELPGTGHAGPGRSAGETARTAEAEPGTDAGTDTAAAPAADAGATAETEAEGPDESTPRGAGVSADGFGLRGARGPVFEDVSLDAPPGSLIAVEGPSGSGRTCLLLALTGRMKATAGQARVAGHRLPKKLAAVRAISALGTVPGVNEPEPALSVAEQIRERVLLRRRFAGPVAAWLHPRRERAAARARLAEALAAAGLDLDSLPKGPRTRIRDLERLEVLRLSVALALLSEPRLLAVDDVDLKLSADERAAAWSMLGSIARRGTTVLAVCSQAPDGAEGTDGAGGAVVVRTRPARGTRDAGEATGTPGEAAGASEPAAAPANGRTTANAKEGAADALAETGRA